MLSVAGGVAVGSMLRVDEERVRGKCAQVAILQALVSDRDSRGSRESPPQPGIGRFPVMGCASGPYAYAGGIPPVVAHAVSATLIRNLMPEADRHAELVSQISANQTRLLAYVYSLTGDRQAADEIVQATNLVIWKKADTYEPGTNFIAWAFKIARLQVLEHRSRVGRDHLVYAEELVEELARVDSADFVTELISDRQAALTACLAELPTSRRELIWLRYRDALSLSDMAARIGKTTSATGVLLHRLRQLLLDCIQRRLARNGG
jgi:RNA polymerase sigma-70 factor, ECF subfamily